MIPMVSKTNLAPYQLSLMLNSNQELASFRETQTLSRQEFGQTEQWNLSDIWLMLGCILWK